GARPGRIEVYDNDNNLVDYTDSSNFRGNTANNATLHNRSHSNQGFLNVRRTLDFMPVPTAVQVGVLQKHVMLDTNAQSITWNFMGPDGASTTTAPIAPYLMQVYRNVDPGYGFRNIPWMS